MHGKSFLLLLWYKNTLKASFSKQIDTKWYQHHIWKEKTSFISQRVKMRYLTTASLFVAIKEIIRLLVLGPLQVQRKDDKRWEKSGPDKATVINTKSSASSLSSERCHGGNKWNQSSRDSFVEYTGLLLHGNRSLNSSVRHGREGICYCNKQSHGEKGHHWVHNENKLTHTSTEDSTASLFSLWTQWWPFSPWLCLLQ